jgi:hypothetical protein
MLFVPNVGRLFGLGLRLYNALADSEVYLALKILKTPRMVDEID